MQYTKPRVPFDEQLNLLRNRDLAVADPARAIKDLKRIGCYRLSGYLYPMRRVEQQPGAKRPRRLDHYVDGAAFEDGVGLHDFDHRLSQRLLDGLQQVETGLRVKVGYILGKRGGLAHLDPANLGPKAQQTSSRLRGQTRYEVWRHQYDQKQAKARNGKQELVLRFEKKYDGSVPIWAAVEFMTMGCLIALLDLLVPDLPAPSGLRPDVDGLPRSLGRTGTVAQVWRVVGIISGQIHRRSPLDPHAAFAAHAFAVLRVPTTGCVWGGNAGVVPSPRASLQRRSGRAWRASQSPSPSPDGSIILLSDRGFKDNVTRALLQYRLRDRRRVSDLERRGGGEGLEALLGRPAATGQWAVWMRSKALCASRRSATTELVCATCSCRAAGDRTSPMSMPTGEGAARRSWG